MDQDCPRPIFQDNYKIGESGSINVGWGQTSSFRLGRSHLSMCFGLACMPASGPPDLRTYGVWTSRCVFYFWFSAAGAREKTQAWLVVLRRCETPQGRCGIWNIFQTTVSVDLHHAYWMWSLMRFSLTNDDYQNRKLYKFSPLTLWEPWIRFKSRSTCFPKSGTLRGSPWNQMVRPKRKKASHWFDTSYPDGCHNIHCSSRTRQHRKTELIWVVW